MALYAIGDLHLSLGADKPMDVFGGSWENYVEKIKLGFSSLHDDDVCVLCGDLAWGMTMEQALPDFQFIEALPGKKILLKGNHDFWWSTAKKAYDFFEAHDTHRAGPKSPGTQSRDTSAGSAERRASSCPPPP